MLLLARLFAKSESIGDVFVTSDTKVSEPALVGWTAN